MIKLTKPIILLDIDGIFNALSKIEEDRELIRHNYGTWQISKSNIEFLKWLSKHFKCVWISTWRENSNIINKHIGIKPFKYDYTGNKEDSVTGLLKSIKNIFY